MSDKVSSVRHRKYRHSVKLNTDWYIYAYRKDRLVDGWTDGLEDSLGHKDGVKSAVDTVMQSKA